MTIPKQSRGQQLNAHLAFQEITNPCQYFERHPKWHQSTMKQETLVRKTQTNQDQDTLNKKSSTASIPSKYPLPCLLLRHRREQTLCPHAPRAHGENTVPSPSPEAPVWCRSGRASSRQFGSGPWCGAPWSVRLNRRRGPERRRRPASPRGGSQVVQR